MIDLGVDASARLSSSSNTGVEIGHPAAEIAVRESWHRRTSCASAFDIAAFGRRCAGARQERRSVDRALQLAVGAVGEAAVDREAERQAIRGTTARPTTVATPPDSA